MNFANNTSTSRSTNTADSTQASRSAARDAEIRRILLRNQYRMAKQQRIPEAPAAPQTTSSNKISPVEVQRKKKQFQKFRFFLYKLDPELETKLARKIYLLGATREAFFSAKCTHVITNAKLISSSKKAAIDPSENDAPVDITIQNARKWKLELWSLEGALKIVNILMESSTANAKAHERAHRDEKKPHFVEFTGHYLLVEDATQVHCPVLIKEYTKELLKDKPTMIPWPTLKRKRRAHQEAQEQQNRNRDPQIEEVDRPESEKKEEGEADKVASKKEEVTASQNEPKKPRTGEANPQKKRGTELQYCENCNEKFAVLSQHILTKKHLTFVQNSDNFLELDQLIDRVQRK
ncbi:DBF zinc finger-domain-containing protein [Sporodiniella umbellata]|nr:DBF zinc finger-domain-containing protein [Sporodiniella umbellata]